MTISEFIEENILLIDSGEFAKLLSRIHILSKDNRKQLIEMLESIFPSEIAHASEEYLDILLRVSFNKMAIELPITVEELFDIYDSCVPGQDIQSLTEYLRKHGHKYGVKIIDNPGYEYSFINYIKTV